MVRVPIASGLSIRVESEIPEVIRFAERMARRGVGNDAAPTAQVTVVPDPIAPEKRYLPDEYYGRLEWIASDRASVALNGATGAIHWPLGAQLQAELRIYPAGAPESLGMFLRVLAAMLLPERSALLLHAAAIVVDERAHLLLGNSGAGKTTTARRTGFQGALRIADDMVVVGVDSVVSVESTVFDRAARLPGRLGREWPLGAAHAVRKGAEKTQVGGRVVDPFQTWCAAVMTPVLPAERTGRVLDMIARLRTIAAPCELLVAPRGDILHALRYSSVP